MTECAIIGLVFYRIMFAYVFERGSNMAKIIIKRKSSMAGCAQSHNVYLVNTFIGELKNGGVLEVPVDVGIHLLSFNSTMKKLGKNATFNVVVNEPDEVVELKTKFGMSGEYEVEYDDNRPHIPVGVNAINNQVQDVDLSNDKIANQNIVAQSSGVNCPRCGSYDIVPISEVSTTGKDFKAGDACCGYMLCGPLGLLCGATGKGKQTTTTTYWMCKGCGNKFQV